MPKEMLVARATAKAVRWFAPEALLGVFTEVETEDWVGEAPTATATVDTPAPVPAPAAPASAPAKAAQRTEPEPAAPTEERPNFELLMQIRKNLPDYVKAEVRDFLAGHGWKATALTEDQAMQVIDFIESLPAEAELVTEPDY
jgi:hypothetical protein